jgi:uncharacterized protein
VPVVTVDEIKRIVADYMSSDERRQANLAAVYLFGSVARGSDRAGSDVDLGFLYQRAPSSKLADQPFGMAADLSDRLRRSVEIVVMNGAPVDLLHRILRDGQLLVERDRSSRIAFEVRARNEYFDLLPILRLYRRRPVTP